MPQLLPTQTKTLELLTHLTSYSDLMVLVSGPDGAGKTTLANALSASREDSETLLIKASVMLGMSGILSAIASHWGLPAIEEDSSENRERIRAESQLRYHDTNNFLVIIDQADQLGGEALNDLAHFALLLQETVSFALFGTTGFERDVKQSPAQAPVYVQVLEPLDLPEARSLLTWAYGVKGSCPLDDKTLGRLLESSDGWPGPLMSQAEQAMGGTGPDGERPVPARQASSRGMIFLLVAASVAIAGVAVYRLYGPELLGQFKPSVAVSVPARTEDVAEPGENVGESPSAVAEQADDVAFQEDTAADEIGVTETAGVEAQPDEQVTAVAETDATAAVAVSPAMTEEAQAAEEEPDALAVLQNETEASSAGAEENTAADRVNEIGGAQGNVPAENVATATAAAEDGATIPADIPPPAAAQSEPEKASVTESRPPSPYSADEAALLAAEDGYIVQLLGTFSQESADMFRSEWQDQIPLYTYRGSYKGRDWFVVTTGIFSDPFSAQEALEELPEQIRSQSPWIRPLSQVKSALR